MLPSLLAREIQNGIRHFLANQYEPSDALSRGSLNDLRMMNRDG